MIPRLAILGTGPSALYLGLLLVQKGWDVRAFDPKMPWETPRGCGIALDALREFPHFEDFSRAGARSRAVGLTTLRVLSPHGREGRIDCPEGFLVASRGEVSGFLETTATNAGVEIISAKIEGVERTGETWRIRSIAPRTGKAGSFGSDSGENPDSPPNPRVEEWEADFLVGADGGVSLARKVLGAFPPSDGMTIEVGYDIPMVIDGGKTAVIKFLREMPGCFWALPLNSSGTSVRLWATSRLLHARNLFEKIDLMVQDVLEIPAPGDSARTVAHIPLFQSPSPASIQGEGWALIAEAAGLVHPLSQDGLWFGLQSAAALALSFHGGRLDETSFRDRIKENVLQPLKARMKNRRWWSRNFILDWMVGRLAHSGKTRNVILELLDPRASPASRGTALATARRGS